MENMKGSKNKTYRVKMSFSLIPEMQAAMLSSIMLPPIHTWTGFMSFRSDIGEQGSRKPATPSTHYMDKRKDIHGKNVQN